MRRAGTAAAHSSRRSSQCGSNAHPGQQSKIRYEFKDATGRLVKGGGTDESWKLYEDMEVPVFYDPENPEKNVTLCAATCELRTD